MLRIERKKINNFSTTSNRRGFRQKLSYKQNRIKHVQEINDDILYEKLSCEGKTFSNLNNISFTWCADGVPVFKSSKFSFWPVYLIMNELPYDRRFNKESLIMVGLWFGEKKPNKKFFFNFCI